MNDEDWSIEPTLRASQPMKPISKVEQGQEFIYSKVAVVSKDEEESPLWFQG